MLELLLLVLLLSPVPAVDVDVTGVLDRCNTTSRCPIHWASETCARNAK